ncbi:SIMPL domain-containing protein [Croceibacter atlanticus]|jgi:uncharacterized protein YggE|uniref:SIMPL domain-containing protein n=1 Tax=Croceibacter atlanticus TaxID=313588 RepID=UPI002E118E0F|nr:SIMPL domain-containing protein [Croceibacter atlanticus]WSP34557.1 SIMPL domain-containing protein [Croceibacter atlanticus]|tara:strand:- start:134876 stop:135565 length:690 start_codon:yes stop_codon:yes gene_type:complete
MKQLTVLLALIFTTTMMTAQQNPQPTISVKGEGVINVVPDHVIVKVRVEEEGTSAVDVKTKTDASVDNVIKFLRKLKIEDKNIQTNFVRLDKSYNYNTKEYKYSSNQSISIKIEDLEQYDAIMSGLLQSGINRIDGIEFGAKNLESLQVEARKKAMLNAKDKAEQYASTLNQTIGKAISISEQGTANPIVPKVRMMAMESDFAGSEPQETLAKGEIAIKIDVNVVFALN